MKTIGQMTLGIFLASGVTLGAMNFAKATETTNPLSIQCKMSEVYTEITGEGDQQTESTLLNGSEVTRQVFRGPVALEYYGANFYYSVGYSWLSQIVLNVGNKANGTSARAVAELKPKLGQSASLSLGINQNQSILVNCSVVKTPPMPTPELPHDH